MTWRIDERLLTAWKQADEDLSALPSPLGAMWRTYERALAERAAVSNLAQALLSAQAFPSLPLVWWTARLVGLDDESVIEDLTYGALMGYLFIRIQDDVLDGHTRSENLLVGNAAQERFQEVYRRHLPSDHPFWSVWLGCLVEFSAATAWEIQSHRNRRTAFTTPDLDRLGEKFLPAAAPPAAVAFLGGRDDLVRPLRELVITLGSGLQLVNDHRGIRHDFEIGNYTAVISDILVSVPKVRLAEELAFPNKALTTDAIERNLRRARIYFERSRQLGADMGLFQVAEYTAEHIEELEEELNRMARIRIEALSMEPEAQIQATTQP